MGAKSLVFLATFGVFLVFFGNVVTGAAGLGVFLSDVGEMLTLFAACVGFVITILLYERTREVPQADAQHTEPKEEKQNEETDNG